jgi:serine/threonine-protein kinase
VVRVFYSTGPRSVPDVRGKTEAEATALLDDDGFQVSVVHDPTTKAKKGTVIQQSPDPGTPWNQGNTVTIVVSTYEKPKPSPTTSPPSPTESPTSTESPSESPSP